MSRWCSTIVALALLIAWLGSGWVYLETVHYVGARRWEFSIGSGLVGVRTWRGGASDCWPSHPFRPYRLRWWFDWDLTFSNDLDVPLWFPMTLTGVPAALLWRRRMLLMQRAGANACGACGYDLTGLPAPDGKARPICPECGA